MPYKVSKTPYRSKKRPSSRKKIAKYNGRGVKMLKDVIPQVYFGKFTYFSEMSSVSATTSPAVHVFRANSLYDPDLTGVGHQPRGFDQMATLYNRYKVNAVGIKVMAHLASNSSSLGTIGVRLFNEDTTTVYSLSDMRENPRAWNVKDVDGQNNKVTVSAYSKLYKIAGVSKKQWDADIVNYGAGTGGSPLKMPYITVAWQSIDEATAFQPLWTATITYYCTMWDRVHLAES